MKKATVYFDGSCPLCRAEISYYRREDSASAFSFIDISQIDASLPFGLTQQSAMQRFHVLDGDGQLLSGAAAFVEVWSRLPGWRLAARVAGMPGAMTTLEFGYRLFLRVRPFISRLFRKMQPTGGLAGRQKLP